MSTKYDHMIEQKELYEEAARQLQMDRLQKAFTAGWRAREHAQGGFAVPYQGNVVIPAHFEAWLQSGDEE